MKLANLLRPECVLVGPELTDKTAALHKIAQTAKNHPILKEISEEHVFHKLQEREALGSTGFGQGVAIPHCRLEGVTDFVLGLISVPGGVDFKASDGKKVELMVFIVAPASESNKHIKILSAISRTFLIPGAVKEILAEETPEAMRESFLRYGRTDIDTREQTTKSMFHVFVQDEVLFQDILGILNAEASSMVVVEAKNTGAYLTKIPLFADFWRDRPSESARTIIAVVEKALANETLRRIETITGDLSDCSGVMVAVQELSYVAGSLNV